MADPGAALPGVDEDVPPMVEVPPVPVASALPVVPGGVPVAGPVPAVLPVVPPGVVVLEVPVVVVSVPALRLQAARDRQAPSSTASATLRLTVVFVIRKLLGLRLSWLNWRPQGQRPRRR
jgi:hypothetical protein